MATYNEIADKIHGVYHQLRITLDGVALTDKLDNVEFNNTVNDAGGLEVGTAYSSTLTFTIDEPTKDLSGAELFIEDGVRDSDGTFQYAPIGYFRVNAATNDRGTYTYECYDRMAYAFSGQYETALTFPATDKAIIEEICQKCKVTFVGDLTAHTVDEKPTGTYKTVLIYMLQLQGKNAFFDTDGTLKIKWYEKADYTIDDSRIYSDGDASTAEKFTFGFVKNVRTVKKTETKYETQTEYDDNGNEHTAQVPYTEESSEEQTYTAGTGLQGVAFQNPYMTQAIVNELYEKLKGFSYTPATFNVVGDFRIRPMTIITANTNNGISYEVPVMSVHHSCDGGLADIISAYGQSESANSLDGTSDASKAMSRYDADLAYLKTVYANTLNAERAKVLYAEISELNATNAKVKKLDADTVKTKELESEVAKFGYAKADELEATVATFGYAKATELEATNARVETLDTSTVKTKDLEAEVAKFGYAKAETVEAGYAKIDFSNVKGQVVDNSMIKDAAIDDAKILGVSANKLTAGTIDASKINVTNLNADNITVGTINGKRIGDGSIDLDKLAQEVPTKEYLDSVESKLQDQIDGAIETFTGSVVPTLKNEPASLWTDDVMKKKHVGDVYYVINAASQADGYCYRFANTGTESSPVWEWALIKDSDVTKALQELINVQGDISGLKIFQTETSSWQTSTADEISSIKTRTTTIETTYSTKTEAESLASNAQKNAESTAKSYTDTATKDMATSTAVANAKKEAIDTAAADATEKANTAKTEAISAAATDAQSKAAAAQAAAEKTAAADATNKANAAATDAKKYADTVVSTKVETSVFNEVKQTVDENSASITKMSQTLSTKADGSTVDALTNTVNAIKQTADENSSSISSITKKVTTVESTANTANKNASDAVDKANTANETANAAKESASKAESKATSAATSATNAEKSATSSANSATNAEKSANDAKASADNAVETANGAAETATEARNTAQSASETASDAKKNADAAVTKTEELTETVNTVKQTADSNTATISTLTKTVETKADGSTVDALTNKTAQLEQNLNGFKTTVSETYVESTTYTEDKKSLQDTVNSANSNASSALTTAQEANNTASTAKNTADSAMTAANASTAKVETEYYKSTSATELTGGSWSTAQPEWKSGAYIWSRNKMTAKNGTVSYSEAACITGAKGDTGSKGDKGDTGSAGRGITSTVITYQAGASGKTAPTGTWSNSIPAVGTGQFLWTKTVVTYSDGKSTTSYAVSYQGTNGTNGTSVTVASTAVTYAVSSNGTTPPTSGWQTSVPSVANGQFLWTKTYVKYSDGKDTTSYAVSYKGTNGTNGKDGAAGADAITVTVIASNGNVFKNNNGSTVLTAHVFKGGVEQSVTDAGVCGSLGSIKWYKGTDTTPIATAKTLTVSANDVDNLLAITAKLDG